MLETIKNAIATISWAAMKTIKECKKWVGLHITTNHGGKMDGMASCSTSPTCNPQCKKNCNIIGAICEKCFSFLQLKAFPSMEKPLAKNYEILTSRILPLEDLPILNYLYFRFEAFGDLGHVNQFINYLNIASVNPGTTFAIWTKNPHIMKKVFDDMGYEKPKNLIIIVSGLFIDKPIKYETIVKKYWFVDKVFNCFSSAEAAEKLGFKINCGDKKCLKCLCCYMHNGIHYINEIVKQEAKKAKAAKKKGGEK
jgi:hypothetical protein